VIGPSAISEALVWLSKEGETAVLSTFATKSVIITGGSSGIGRALVERFSKGGASVTFSFFSDETRATELATRTGARAVRVDLASPGDIDLIFARAADEFGGVDVVVNNAAVLHHSIPVVDVTPEDYEFVVGGNLRGSFLVLQNAVRTVRDNGRIISISTLDTANASPGSALYAAGKAAVERIVATISKEVGQRGITANSVSPGAVDTARLHMAHGAEELERAARATPLGRLTHPDDIADVVEFLASPAGGWITGQNICATGGLG